MVWGWLVTASTIDTVSNAPASRNRSTVMNLRIGVDAVPGQQQLQVMIAQLGLEPGVALFGQHGLYRAQLVAGGPAFLVPGRVHGQQDAAGGGDQAGQAGEQGDQVDGVRSGFSLWGGFRAPR
jgi:hypothetical protein